MRKKLYCVALSLGLCSFTPIVAQEHTGYSPAKEVISQYFLSYSLPGYVPREAMRCDSCAINEKERSVTVYVNEAFCSQPFTPKSVGRIYKDLSRSLPQPFNTYKLSILSGDGRRIEDFIPNMLREGNEDQTRLWGNINYAGAPWVANTSRPFSITRGLNGRHLMINASHGRYYHNGEWRWQRPYIFCTTEDLFTQSFVFPYIIPMLENAGAVVATGRERDTQTFEAVIDNDASKRQGSYTEIEQEDFAWQTTPDSVGFAMPSGLLNDCVFPFSSGTSRQVAVTNRRSRLAQATWTPRIPKTGRYAVYVSYASRPNSVSDAHYIVYHKGGRTQFRVNQQMGGGTWVYLGSFEFDEGENREGRVVLTNQSSSRGVVTADAARFGGGVGQTERGNAGTSGLPRFLEGARYQAQWSGLPDSLYNKDCGQNDYNDDIRSRSFMLNYLGGGSVYMPGKTGKGVPFELALAVHSDAGIRHDNSIYGTLGICTTVDDEKNTTYPSGLSRQASSDFIGMTMTNVTDDLSRLFNIPWTRRELWDRNYGESRTPNVPSAILEMLSHQNFADMKYGHDPLFKFALSRAVYKSILQFVCYEHGIKNYEVQPLPVHHFSATLTPEGKALLSWRATADTLCEKAAPTGYVVYTKIGDEDFDNGLVVDGNTSVLLPVSEGLQYSYKVTAINQGGESFPSETLTLRRGTAGSKRILIVNGFERLSGPAWVERHDSLGFDLREDLGVPYEYTTAFAGAQKIFNRNAAGLDETHALGFCGKELVGKKVMGNTFDYPSLHGAAIAKAGDYTFVSASREAFTDGTVDAADYDMLDYICGMERDAPQNLRPYKALPPSVRNRMTAYLRSGGNMLLSGCYLGSDLKTESERAFARNYLKFDFAGTASKDSTNYVRGLNLSLPVRKTFDKEGYLLQNCDKLVPADPKAFTAFAYGAGGSAGIAYPGNDYRLLVMGFPFETITSAHVRQQAMKAILTFLTK